MCVLFAISCKCICCLHTLALYDGAADPVSWTDKALLNLSLHDVPESKGKTLVRLALTGAAEAWLVHQTRSDIARLNEMTTAEFLAHMITRHAAGGESDAPAEFVAETIRVRELARSAQRCQRLPGSTFL